MPVLFSGLATLVLNKAETNIIDKHYQYTMQNLQRLHRKTPRSIVLFLAGSLPGEAILHMRQLSLLSMICHLPDDPLHQHAKYTLSTLSPASLSWFHQVRDLCLQYNWPHPLVLLDQPVSKNKFRKLVKLKVAEYWHQVLAAPAECSSPSMTSLQYFDPYKASLLHPHPMWTSSAGNSFECSKSTVLARMVSGRYRTEAMCRFWSTNRSGYCLSDTCQDVKGDLVHLLIVCPALEHTRHRLHSLWCLKTADCPPLQGLIVRILSSPPESQVRFILDSTSCPELIKLVQIFGMEIQDRILYLTRTWAFSIHRQKLKLLGRWPECPKKRMTHPKPSAPPTQPNRPYNPQQRQITDINFNDRFDRENSDITGVTLALNNLINNFVFPGSSNPHQSSPTPPPASTTSVPYDVELIVPANQTVVHHREQPSDAMPEPISSYNCSNFSPTDDRVVGLKKNLVGQWEGHGVTGCSPSSVAGHQQSESARPLCQSCGQPHCLSAAQSAFSSIIEISLVRT